MRDPDGTVLTQVIAVGAIKRSPLLSHGTNDHNADTNHRNGSDQRLLTRRDDGFHRAHHPGPPSISVVNPWAILTSSA